MKKLEYILLILLVLYIPMGMVAQTTLHVIYNMNNNNSDNIYAGCNVDQKNAHDVFSTIKQLAVSDGAGLEVKEHYVNFNKTSALDKVKNLQVSPNDAVIFFYSGHGIVKGKNHRWPTLVYTPENELGTELSENDLLALKDIHNALKEKNIRMSITLGSACSENPETEDGAENPVITSAELGRNGGGKHNNYGLFTEFSGHILSSGAAPGQYAYLNDKDGSYFINTFLNVIAEGMFSATGTSWASIFKKTSERVNGAIPKQRPQFMIFKNGNNMYSEEETQEFSDDEGDNLTAIDASEFSLEWEMELDREEAIELLPYILVDALNQQITSTEEDHYNDQLDRILDFYKQEILISPYFELFEEDNELHKEFCSNALNDSEEDAEGFSEYLQLAQEMYSNIPEDLRLKIQGFISTLK